MPWFDFLFRVFSKDFNKQVRWRRNGAEAHKLLAQRFVLIGFCSPSLLWALLNVSQLAGKKAEHGLDNWDIRQ